MFEKGHHELTLLSPGGLSRGRLCDLIEGLSRLEGHVVACRLAAIAAVDGLADGGMDAEGVARSVGRRSLRTAKRVAEVAGQLKDMPKLAEALAEGAINEEHVSVAADVASRVSPGEADEALLARAKGLPPEAFAKQARSWADKKESDSSKLDRHQQLREKRECRMWRRDGMFHLYGRFDPVTGAAMQKRLDEKTDQLWRNDGGRGGTPDDVREPDQRRADALHELITSPNSKKSTHPKHQIIVRADISRLTSDNPTGVAEIIDGEALPQAVLERLACNGEFTGAIYSQDGEPLWLGRTKRAATDAQWKGLIDRDGGCCSCGADASRCEAHHIIPWLDLGPSDITNYKLLCTHEHHLIHDHGYTLVQENGEWSLKPPTSTTKRKPTWQTAA